MVTIEASQSMNSSDIRYLQIQSYETRFECENAKFAIHSNFLGKFYNQQLRFMCLKTDDAINNSLKQSLSFKYLQFLNSKII